MKKSEYNKMFCWKNNALKVGMKITNNDTLAMSNTGQKYSKKESYF